MKIFVNCLRDLNRTLASLAIVNVQLEAQYAITHSAI